MIHPSSETMDQESFICPHKVCEYAGLVSLVLLGPLSGMPIFHIPPLHYAPEWLLWVTYLMLTNLAIRYFWCNDKSIRNYGLYSVYSMTLLRWSRLKQDQKISCTPCGKQFTSTAPPSSHPLLSIWITSNSMAVPFIWCCFWFYLGSTREDDWWHVRPITISGTLRCSMLEVKLKHQKMFIGAKCWW